MHPASEVRGQFSSTLTLCDLPSEAFITGGRNTLYGHSQLILMSLHFFPAHLISVSTVM